MESMISYEFVGQETPAGSKLFIDKNIIVLLSFYSTLFLNANKPSFRCLQPDLLVLVVIHFYSNKFRSEMINTHIYVYHMIHDRKILISYIIVILINYSYLVLLK